MGNTLIKVTCTDQRLILTANPRIASGGQNEDVVEFEFCPLWDGLKKTAVFYRNEPEVYNVELTDDRCVIPYEVLSTEGTMYFGVFGVKDDITRTSEIISYRVVKGALVYGTLPGGPTPNIFDQVKTLQNTVNQLSAKTSNQADQVKSLQNSVNQLSEEIDILLGSSGQQYEEIKYGVSSFEKAVYVPIGDLETVDVTARKQSDGSWHTLVVQCKAGTKAIFTASGGANSRAFAVVASDGTVLSRAGSNVTLTDYELQIDSDATLVINSDNKVDFYLTLQVPVVRTNTVEGIKRRFETDAWYVADEWKTGYINTSGGVGSTVDLENAQSTNYSHMIIDCYSGMRFKITGRGGGSGRLWCFVDNEGVIQSAAEAYAKDTEVVAPIDGKIIINAENVASHPKSVEYTPFTLAPIAKLASDNRNSIETIQKSMFGIGIDCKYAAPDIDALNNPAKGERLTYYYGLYDALMEAYPEYISKVDCDAVAAEAGIERPSAMADYPIYLYKFVPAYTSNSTKLDGVTDQSKKITVFVTTGTHPEYMAIWDAYHTMRLICENWKTDDNLEALRWDCEIYVMPCSGAYVVENGTRTNYNGVDLNRNTPSSNWVLTAEGNTYSGPSAGSEYETKVFVHFMGLLNPDLYIDHHNTDPYGNPGEAFYGTATLQKDVDIMAEHMSVMSRRWKERFDTVFPQNDTMIFGHVGNDSVHGSRQEYGYEKVGRSVTYESQGTLLWDNGEQVSGAHSGDTVACTCATDGFINLLLRMLKMY